MNISGSEGKTILINLDLLFDFYSVFFSVYRTYFAKHSISISNLKYCIEGKNFDDGLKSLLQQVSGGLDVAKVKEELTPLLDISLSSLKPRIGAYTLVKDLAKNGVVIKAFTHFNEEVLKYLKEAHKDWFDIEIIQLKDIQDAKEAINQTNKDTTIVINSSIDCCINMKKEEDVRTVFVPHSKETLEIFSKDEKLRETFNNLGIQIFDTLEKINWDQLGVPNTLKWSESSYFLKLDEKPQNAEYQVWKNVSKLKEPIELISNIVHGFGRGGKKLGIPTANLDMTPPEIEEKIVDLVSGVYYGWAEFLPSSQTDKNEGFEYNNSFPMVMSIGFNPYFNNKYKTAEAHIMRKFEHDFYDSKLKVTILGFIRNEADFLTFSHLIEAIHNDVQVAKDLLNSNAL
jgi:riboflavin kinase